MSSYLMCYSVLRELNTLDAGRSWSMCGVIVVNAGRSWSTDTDVIPIFTIIALDIVIIFALFYQLLGINLFTHRMLSSREKPLVKPMAPGSIFHCVSFQSINQKTQKYLAAIYLYLL